MKRWRMRAGSRSVTPAGFEASMRAPMNHELDLRVDRRFALGPAKLTAFADVQNVYMHQADIAYFYNYDYMQRGAFRSLPIIPSIGLRGVF